jgi:hypothetical protein
VLVLFPMLELVVAFGILRAVEGGARFYKLGIGLVIVLAFAGNAAYFAHQYVIHGSSHFTQYRFNGFKEMVLAVQAQYGESDTIIMTKTSGGIYPHVLFYSQYDPTTYQKEGSPKDPDFGGFGKFIFTPQFCPSTQGDDRFPKTGRVVYVDSGTCEVSPLISQQRIMREDGTVGFIITTNQRD